MNVIPIWENIETWETVTVKVETDSVNPITVKLLERDFKYIYTFIKKRKTVKALEVFQRFPKMNVEKILIDLRLMNLVYFTREMK